MSTTATTTRTSELASEPGPSNTRLPSICTVCNSQPPKYTCPRCKTKTCSLPCSREHKAATGCSGERERTTFVPMNQYGYTALMNDYVFLEEMGRKVENWGREIVQSGLDLRGMSTNKAPTASRMGRGPGRMPRRGKDRKSILAMQLGIRDIDMDVLPNGMKRATMNSSYWDMKGKRALLTVEFSFQPPPDPVTRRELKPVSITTHRKDWDQTIRKIIRTSIQEAKKTREYDELLKWLDLDEEDETIPSSVLCLMKKPRSYDEPIDLNKKRQAYYRLDWNEKLSKVLRHKHFVEFPTILLVDESSFDGVLVDDSGIEEDMRERRAKRQKLNSGEAKKTLSSLVGGYGSEEEDETNVLDTLADYSESESRENGDTSEPDAETADEVGEEQDDDAQDLLDSAIMSGNSMEVNGACVEEDVDWGDDEIAEDEAKLAELSAAIQQRNLSR